MVRISPTDKYTISCCVLLARQKSAIIDRTIELIKTGSIYNNVIKILESDSNNQFIQNRRELEIIYEDIEKWSSQGIRFLKLGDPEYPYKLAEIERPPLILYYQGDGLLKFNQKISVAVVGSRNCDTKGRDIAKKFSRYLSDLSITVVSGLAIGIDGAAHEGALDGSSDLPTVGVLGGGINNLYPSNHLKLAQRIINSGGAILSQFEPDTIPFPGNFLQRNRIISGLSQAVFVAQAAQKSGALATARFALEQGRDVMAVPGTLGDIRYEGTNALLKDGAYFITQTSDIAEIVLGVGAEAGAKVGDSSNEDNSNAISGMKINLKKELKELHCYIQNNQPVHITSIQEHFPPTELYNLTDNLLELELQGYINEHPGMWYALAT